MFVGRMGRFPRSIKDKDAELYDVLMHRMAHDLWNPLQRSCTDKVTAKDVAKRLAPDVQVARTEAVLDGSGQITVSDTREMLRPHLGKPLVAKPAHASGGFIDLSVPLNPEKLTILHQSLTRDYFYVHRETQYYGLPRRLIVEEKLASERGLPDYKFFCIFGTPVTVQIDFDRFDAHRRAIVYVDDFRWVPGRFGASHILPATTPPDKPESWAQMLSLVHALSKPFDFVRIDLYDTPHGVYFSEFTFTPDVATAFADSAEMRLYLNTLWKNGVSDRRHSSQ
jgi:hypothetical protein